MFRHGGHLHHRGHEPDALVDEVVKALNLSEGMIVADLGSGPGRFSIPLARAVGRSGRVYAIDIDEGSLKELANEASSYGLNNVETIRADLSQGIPLQPSSVDVALMANALHGFMHAGVGPFIVREVERILKSGGLFVVVEFKKSITSFGPPPWIRVSPDEVIDLVKGSSQSLAIEGRIDDVGRSHYLLKFRKTRG